MEREVQLANREKAGGGSKRKKTSQPSDLRGTSEDLGGTLEQRDQEESENSEGPESVSLPLDRPKSKKGDYPALGPNGPGDLNVEEDWEGPIELFEFGESDDGWVNCTTGYYWHPGLSGTICLYGDKWY